MWAICVNVRSAPGRFIDTGASTRAGPAGVKRDSEASGELCVAVQQGIRPLLLDRLDANPAWADAVHVVWPTSMRCPSGSRM